MKCYLKKLLKKLSSSQIGKQGHKIKTSIQILLSVSTTLKLLRLRAAFLSHRHFILTTQTHHVASSGRVSINLFFRKNVREEGVFFIHFWFGITKYTIP
jgi:hypothetical protein